LIKKLILLAAVLFFVGCGGGTTTYRAEPVEAKNGEPMQLSDGQTLGVSGNNNDVQAISVEDGSTYVYCKAGDTCTPIMYSEVTTTTNENVEEDDDDDDMGDDDGGM
jgi:hypothetical protein